MLYIRNLYTKYMCHYSIIHYYNNLVWNKYIILLLNYYKYSYVIKTK